MKLYTNRISPNAKRVRTTAAELGCKLETIEIDFGKGDNKKPEYLQLNPMGKVPVFVDDDGTTLWESPAICVYLAEKMGKLRPTDAKGRAEQFRWMFWNASHLEPAIFAIGFEKLIKPMMGMTTDQNRIDAEMKNVERYAAVIDHHLDHKDWVLGKELSIADFDLGSTIDFAMAASIDLGKYPHLKSWWGRISERPSWKA